MIECLFVGGICVNVGCMFIKIMIVFGWVVYFVFCGVDYGVYGGVVG